MDFFGWINGSIHQSVSEQDTERERGGDGGTDYNVSKRERARGEREPGGKVRGESGESRDGKQIRALKSSCLLKGPMACYFTDALI